MTNKSENTQIQLIKQEQKFMNEKIDKNHGEVMGAVSDIKDSIKDMGNNFATKDEHKHNKESISKLWKIVWAVVGFVFIAVGSAALSLLIK